MPRRSENADDYKERQRGIRETLESLLRRYEEELVELRASISVLLNEKATLQSEKTALGQRVESLVQTLQKREKTLERVKTWLQVLIPLGEPPYFPAVFLRLSQAHDPRKEQVEKVLGFVPKYNKCWLLTGGGEETVGTVTQELGTVLKIGQLVLVNNNRAIVAAIPEDEVEAVISSHSATVSRVVDGTVYVSDGFRDRVKVVAVSENISAEVRQKSLEPGDVVLVFAGCILKILERKTLTTTKKNIKKVGFSDVGGLDTQIQEIRELLGLDFDEESWKAMGMEFPRGVVLYGPPGCGKNLLVAALAARLGWCLEVINGSEISSMWVGETPRMMRESFQLALKNKPSIWFVDEADALFPVRGSSIAAEHKTDYTAQFNTLLDGLEDTRGVFVILATNRLDQIDPAAIRAERFTKKLEVSRPDKKAAAEILRIYFHRRRLSLKGASRDDVAQYIVTKIIDELYAKRRSTLIFTAFRIGESRGQRFFFRHFVSGALLKSIVDEIALRALRRQKDQSITPKDPHFGIIEEDIENVVSEIILDETPRDVRSLNQWLMVNGYKPADDFRSGLLKITEE